MGKKGTANKKKRGEGYDEKAKQKKREYYQKHREEILKKSNLGGGLWKKSILKGWHWEFKG